MENEEKNADDLDIWMVHIFSYVYFG